MRLLIISSYYSPEGAGTAPYVTGMAEDLAARGHTVDVATTFPHYPEWKSTSHRRMASRERLNGVTVRRRALYVPGRQSSVERALYEASMFLAGLTAIGARHRPDAVLGFIPSLSAGVLTKVAGQIYRVPYGLIIHDLMGPGADQSGVAGGRRVASAVAGIEGTVARGADVVAVIADAFRAYYEQHDVPAERFHRVRTWTRRSEPTADREQTRERCGWQPDHFVCIHAGNMGQKQGLDNLLTTASLLQHSKVRIVFVGDGNDRGRLMARAAEMALANVEFLPMQGPGEYESILLAADALLLNQRAAVGDMSLPSKLTSYFAAGRPVVAAISRGSETEREMRASGGGIVVPADTPSALADALQELAADAKRRALYAQHGQEYARTVLDPRTILAEYEALAVRVVAS